MIIDFISDLHGYTPKLQGGDLLIIAGDLTGRDTKLEYDRFLAWLNPLPYRCKIVIAGNHDGLLEKGLTLQGENLIYLCDTGTEFEGLKIWGSPYTPTFFDWHFMRDRGAPIKKHWDLIPAHTDILVTHGPPNRILDLTEDKIHAGCEELTKAVQALKPRIHCFGHIHEGGGRTEEIDGVTYINCSYVNERYRPVHGAIRKII